MANFSIRLREGEIEVAALTRFNWEQVLDLEVEAKQRDFMPPLLFSIAQSKFDNCTPCGIFYKGKLCGFVMFCIFQQTAWVNRILVDKTFQRNGIGGTAMGLLLRYLSTHPDCREIRTSFAEENFPAERLFASAGFVSVGMSDSGEIVQRFVGR